VLLGLIAKNEEKQKLIAFNIYMKIFVWMVTKILYFAWMQMTHFVQKCRGGVNYVFFQFQKMREEEAGCVYEG
jgi:hypothetical protein